MPLEFKIIISVAKAAVNAKKLCKTLFIGLFLSFTRKQHGLTVEKGILGVFGC